VITDANVINIYENKHTYLELLKIRHKKSAAKSSAKIYESK